MFNLGMKLPSRADFYKWKDSANETFFRLPDVVKVKLSREKSWVSIENQ